MKRLSLFLAGMLIVFGMMAESAKTVTVTPSNPRSLSRFIYNYRAVLADFDIKPDISPFVTSETPKMFPSFIIKGRDGHLYAISAADRVVFADAVTVSIKDSVLTSSFNDLHVVNINEKLNLAAIRLPKDDLDNAIAIDSVWFSDQDEAYTMSARMFMTTLPSNVAGDASTLPSLYNRMAEIAPDGYSYILPNLSYKYLFSKSADQIANGIEELSDADYKVFQKMNAEGDVIGAMRILAGDMAARSMKKNLNCTNTRIGDKQTVLEGSDNEYITFAQEFGAWRMVSDQKPAGATTTTTAQYTTTTSSQQSSEANNASSGVVDQYFVGTLINGKVMVPYDFTATGVSGSVSIGYVIRYVSFEAVFEYNSFSLVWGENMIEHPSYGSFFGAGIRIGGLVPLNVSQIVTLVPNIKFQWASPYCFSKPYSGWVNTFSPMAGMDVAFRIGKNGERAFVGFQYEHKFIPYYSSLNVRNMGYFNFQLGFVF